MTRYAPSGAVAAAHHLASAAGVLMLDRGGNAADAAVAAGAVMAVVAPHMCGLGGDLFAMVAWPGQPVTALNASGRAGSGADAAALRAEGMSQMPFQHDIRCVTLPGCVDGLVGLHSRFGSLPLTELLGPAQRLASAGYPVSAGLAEATGWIHEQDREAAFGSGAVLRPGQRIALPGIARALEAIAGGGRAAFYEGAVGADILAIGAGEFTEEDLRVSQANWAEPLGLTAFGRRLWTVPPNSQGYLALAGAWIAEHAGIPEDPQDDSWAPVLVESARQAAFDRPAVLHEDADGLALISPDRLQPRVTAARESSSGELADVYQGGGTTHICAVDGSRAGVSLIMSNAADFGSHLVLRDHGIFLHNRGIGFSLEPGHPAEYKPGRRPPHTLSPLVVTDPAGDLDTVLGSMGGDAQPQILLQLLARLFAAGQDAGAAVAAPRWALSREPTNSFDVWNSAEPLVVRVEGDAPPGWTRELRKRGYQVIGEQPGDLVFGHAQVIQVTDDGLLAGAADARSGDGAFTGY
jgi:gamma-glutamyltranspeptidase / glutathione hydrolase